MTNSKSLIKRIRQGEDSTLEFKHIFLTGYKVTSPKRNDLADVLAGMANGWGGTVLLGVEDRRHEVIGIPIEYLDLVETWASEICSDSVHPPLDALIQKVELPGIEGKLVSILSIDISRSLFVHRSPGGYFRRIGSSNREMSPEVLARLFQERSQSRVIRYDESLVPRTTPGILEPKLINKLLRRNQIQEDTLLSENMLRRFGIIANDENGEARVTVAGILMCTRLPGTWMPHAYIQAVSYVGERRDINYQSDARDCVGSLDTQVFEALDFVRKNMLVGAIKNTARVEHPPVQ